VDGENGVAGVLTHEWPEVRLNKIWWNSKTE